MNVVFYVLEFGFNPINPVINLAVFTGCPKTIYTFDLNAFNTEDEILQINNIETYV